MAERKKRITGMKLSDYSGVKSEVQLEESDPSQEIVQTQQLQEGEEVAQTQLEEGEQNQKLPELEQVEATKRKQVEAQFEAETETEPEPPDKATAPAAALPSPLSPPSLEKLRTSDKKKLAPVNIKLEDRQRVLLDEKARLIRSNNLEAVPAKDRVYPQHLIAVAIDLLLKSDIDWSEVKNIEQLRESLNLGK
jgi:hypothetical protein